MIKHPMLPAYFFTQSYEHKQPVFSVSYSSLSSSSHDIQQPSSGKTLREKDRAL